MMLFDTNHDDIVIVPPKPDFAFLTEDEFSYSNLYCYDEQSDTNNCGTSSSNTTATTTTTAASVSSDSTTTLSSSNNERSSSTVSSFDSSVFNNGGAANNNKHADTTVTTTTATSSNKQRDPRNGAFTFQVHAEYDLLLHVQKDLDKHRSKSSSLSDIQLSKIILRSIDEYCLQKQWMYHIGSEKGVAIGRFLRGGAEKFLKRRSLNNGEVKKFVCVELGTYCGYSALVLASTLCQFLQDLISSSSSSSSSEQAPFEFHIYTTEVSSKLLNVAQSVFRLAKMEHYITPILMPESTIENNGTHHPRSMLSQTLLNQHNVSHIDFLLLDHAKHLYLDDLQDLENAKLLRAGSHVSADNVVFNRLDAYRDHMHKLVLEGVVESRLEEMNLEYSNNLKDGMEMTVYLKDPPTE